MQLPTLHERFRRNTSVGDLTPHDKGDKVQQDCDLHQSLVRLVATCERLSNLSHGDSSVVIDTPTASQLAVRPCHCSVRPHRSHRRDRLSKMRSRSSALKGCLRFVNSIASLLQVPTEDNETIYQCMLPFFWMLLQIAFVRLTPEFRSANGDMRTRPLRQPAPGSNYNRQPSDCNTLHVIALLPQS